MHKAPLELRANSVDSYVSDSHDPEKEACGKHSMENESEIAMGTPPRSSCLQ